MSYTPPLREPIVFYCENRRLTADDWNAKWYVGVRVRVFTHPIRNQHLETETCGAAWEKKTFDPGVTVAVVPVHGLAYPVSLAQLVVVDEGAKE